MKSSSSIFGLLDERLASLSSIRCSNQLDKSGLSSPNDCSRCRADSLSSAGEARSLTPSTAQLDSPYSISRLSWRHYEKNNPAVSDGGSLGQPVAGLSLPERNSPNRRDRLAPQRWHLQIAHQSASSQICGLLGRHPSYRSSWPAPR